MTEKIDTRDLYNNASKYRDHPGLEDAYRRLSNEYPERVWASSEHFADKPWAEKILRESFARIVSNSNNYVSSSDLSFKYIAGYPYAKDLALSVSREYPEKMWVNKSSIEQQEWFPQIVNEISSEQNLEKIIQKNGYSVAIELMPYFKDKSYAKDILHKIAEERPHLIIENLSAIAETPYATDILTTISKTRPHIIFRSTKQLQGLPDVANLLVNAARSYPPEAMNYAIPSGLEDFYLESVVESGSGGVIGYSRVKKEKPPLIHGKEVVEAALKTNPFVALNDTRYLASIKDSKPEALAPSEGRFRRSRHDWDSDLFGKSRTPKYPGLIRVALEKESLLSGARMDPIGAYKAVEHYKHLPFASAIADEARKGMDDAFKKTPKDTSLRVMRVVNDLHDEADPVRYKILDGLSSDQLYKVITHGRSEIFTSSYNGTLNRMLDQLKKEGKSVNDIFSNPEHQERLPVFFEAAASFGRIEDVLKSLPTDADRSKTIELMFDSVKQALSSKTRLPKAKTIESLIRDEPEQISGVQAAISLAETMGALKNPETIKAFESRLLDMYEGAKGNAKKALGLVAGAYQSGYSPVMADQFSKHDFSANYPVATLKGIEEKDLFDSQGRHVQQMFFYGDVDAKASYANLLAQYKGKDGWKTEVKNDFTVISKEQNGRTVMVVANNPGKDIGAASKFIKDELKTSPQFVVHRGHSYHTSKTMPHIGKDAKAVFWGSCGGYNEIAQTLAISPNAQIISTQGTGDKDVNDPLFKMINERLLSQGNIAWSEVWKQAHEKFMSPVIETKDKELQFTVKRGKNGEPITTRKLTDSERDAYIHFPRYVSPEKNWSTTFIQSYRNLAEPEVSDSSIPDRSENIDTRNRGSSGEWGRGAGGRR